MYFTAALRRMLSPRRLVPGTLRLTGRTLGRHQPPGCPTTRTQRWTPRTTLQGARRQSPAPEWDLPSTTNSPRTMAGPPGVSGQRRCWSSAGRGRCSGTQASGTTSSRFSMFLCCRWWNSCRTSFSSLPRIYRWLPSRLSTCRRSCLTEFHSVLCSAILRRKQNSWWKCLRSYPILRCKGLWSRSLTFQFLLVVVVGEVFKIYPPEQNSTAFGGTEHVAIPVPGGSLHVLPDPGGSRSSAASREEAGQGVFRTFPWVNKKPEVRRESECGAAPGGQVMDAGGL